jgi:hypothetical protein
MTVSRAVRRPCDLGATSCRRSAKKLLICSGLLKPSDGLEPPTPSLPWIAAGNRSQPTATVFAYLGRARGRPICDWLPSVATAGLHKGSILRCLFGLRATPRSKQPASASRCAVKSTAPRCRWTASAHQRRGSRAGTGARVAPPSLAFPSSSSEVVLSRCRVIRRRAKTHRSPAAPRSSTAGSPTLRNTPLTPGRTSAIQPWRRDSSGTSPGSGHCARCARRLALRAARPSDPRGGARAHGRASANRHGRGCALLAGPPDPRVPCWSSSSPEWSAACCRTKHGSRLRKGACGAGEEGREWERKVEDGTAALESIFRWPRRVGRKAADEHAGCDVDERGAGNLAMLRPPER